MNTVLIKSTKACYIFILLLYRKNIKLFILACIDPSKQYALNKLMKINSLLWHSSWSDHKTFLWISINNRLVHSMHAMICGQQYRIYEINISMAAQLQKNVLITLWKMKRTERIEFICRSSFLEIQLVCNHTF